MLVSTQAVCLLLLAVSVPCAIGDVSQDEIEKIQKGIEAGKDFTDALGKASGFKDFTKALGKMNDMIGPWVDGIGIFSSVLGMFLPEDNELLNAMKEGFKEVNKRLDDIKEGLEEVKEAIDWAVVKVNFVGIENDIRLMDEKYKEVIQAPNPEHGKEEFIRVYEDEYNEAGILLWDAIVNDDQVFSENVLRAGMKYTDYRRSKMNDFMKGLIALLMKSSDIEVGYEKFKEHDRGMVAIWQERLQQSQKAFEKADKELENAWKNLFRGEVDKLSKECDGWDNESFRNVVWDFLNDKYSWLYWFVLIYQDVGGYDNHAVHYYTMYSHVQFRHYGRNFMISATYPTNGFDSNAAQSAIKHTNCPHSSGHCQDNSARVVLEETPWHGVSKASIRLGKGYAMIGLKGRCVYGGMNLYRGSWARGHWMFYSG